MKAKRPKNILFFIGLSFFCIVLWVSCRGDGVGLDERGDLEGDQPPSGFAALIQPIFEANCIRCHVPGGIGFLQTGGDQNNGLDLTRGNSHGRLVNQPTFEAPDVPPRWRVLPEEPDSSYIIQKITSTSPKSGSRMPLDGPPFLSQNDINLIRMWIEEGAQNN